jgi:hypothetical protein
MYQINLVVSQPIFLPSLLFILLYICVKQGYVDSWRKFHLILSKPQYFDIYDVVLCILSNQIKEMQKKE